jgi:ribonucleoside-diphosphate reductase beta chain
MTIGLLTPSTGYKPFRYPWAYDFWKTQQQVHWLPEEVPLGEDCKNWDALSVAEKNFLTHIFRFFTQADIDVLDNYQERYARVFKPVEVKMMLGAFQNMETVHVAAYSHLLDTVGMPEIEYSAFMQYKAMKDKHDYMDQFGMKSHADILTTLTMFGAFSEGLQLFASFAMLMNFPRHNKMKGMGQIVSWSVRDESLHCEGIMRLAQAFSHETGIPITTGEVGDRVLGHCAKVVEMEDAFIDLAFEMGPLPGLTAEDMKKYVRFIADWRLMQLGFKSGSTAYEGPMFRTDQRSNPLPWLQPLLSAQEHANFFEQRSTEYSKASSTGAWPAVWTEFDKRIMR